MSAAALEHACGTSCISDPVDGTRIHCEDVGIVGGVGIVATSDDTGRRVQVNTDGLADMTPESAVRLAARLLEAVDRFSTR